MSTQRLDIYKTKTQTQKHKTRKNTKHAKIQNTQKYSDPLRKGQLCTELGPPKRSQHKSETERVRTNRVLKPTILSTKLLRALLL